MKSVMISGADPRKLPGISYAIVRDDSDYSVTVEFLKRQAIKNCTLKEVKTSPTSDSPINFHLALVFV
jgi:hypothetical protein